MDSIGFSLFFFAFFLSSPALLQATFLTVTTRNLMLESIVCQNNGTMSVNNTCQCLAPWTGENCTEYACVNGLSVGSQFDENSIFFNKRCICDSGYIGELCEIPLVNPCGSHGILLEEKCACNANYSGSKCENVDFCLHGQLSSGRCNCHYGWSSDFCHIIVCHQGYGDITNSTCTCRSGYRGTFCDLCAESEEGTTTTPYPECALLNASKFYESKRFIIATGAVLIVIFLSCLIIFCVLRKRNQRLQRRRRNGAGENNLKRRMQRMNSEDENDFL